MNYLTLKSQKISYKIRRSKKVARVTIKVNSEGVELVLPLGVSAAKGEEFLRSKAKWIEKKLNVLSKDNGKYFLLGKEVFPVTSNGILNFSSAASIKTQTDEAIKLEFEKFLFAKAQQYIPERVAQLAFQYDFEFNRVKVKKLKSRWGSCSSKKNLSFNYRLMEYSPAVIDYVIIHELCHTRIMNHSKKFWTLVGGIIPDYKLLKQKLNKRERSEG